MTAQEFIQAGFTVVGTETNENKLLQFLKEHYPSVIKDNEINMQELKAILGLPVDEKVNGYGLNFVGRNVARAKYAQKTDKELKLNTDMSKNIDTTQNLVLKGDNLDCLKILKNYYSGKIKCIYIDPPYNTDKDEFVYPDKFDKEEAEVLGLANLSDDDFDRMEFAFKTKKSHNGWLAFMYPRLLLARDLLSDDGVIFISIDDNEQANLKLLCDEIFGEENFVANFVRKSGIAPRQDAKHIAVSHDIILCYSKNILNLKINRKKADISRLKYKDGHFESRGYFDLNQLDRGSKNYSESLDYPIIIEKGTVVEIFDGNNFEKKEVLENIEIWPGDDPLDKRWIFRWSKEKVKWGIENDFIVFRKIRNKWKVYYKEYEFVDNNNNPRERTNPYDTLLLEFYNELGNFEIEKLFEKRYFDYPKPTNLIKHLLKIGSNSSDIILDFFAGSGTTGHAVMQLNAEDGGNRKFILVQIDEPIKEDKPAYKFCIDNK
ncbi:MAG: site-specific DNA-methyltransferase, partial [Patescibacteria group bacterium]|nr:site-specific DNA-methyltransferase [Patescibacteria group bacterium]